MLYYSGVQLAASVESAFLETLPLAGLAHPSLAAVFICLTDRRAMFKCTERWQLSPAFRTFVPVVYNLKSGCC